MHDRSARTIADPEALIAALRATGRRVIGPVERDAAVVPAEITGAADLPRGRVDRQGPGRYRLEDGDPDRWFDYVVGPQGWRARHTPPRRRLWSARRSAEGFEITEEEAEAWPATAFLAVRPCEIAAMRLQDRVFAEGPGADPDCLRRRAGTLVVAVQCARSAETCFCASAGTGPRAEDGFDLALTELDGGFLLEIGSDAGAEVAARLDAPAATPKDRAEAEAATRAAAAAQTRRLPGTEAAALRDNPDHPRWDEVAERCLACANCTLVCPTCFCNDAVDVTDLSGEHAERWRVTASCFELDFSRLADAGPVRETVRGRYRQWLTHKLSSWWDQFGASGCVGCGRCIAWCPVGIDLTEEAAAIAAPEEERA